MQLWYYPTHIITVISGLQLLYYYYYAYAVITPVHIVLFKFVYIGEVLIACGNNQTTLYLTAAHGELSVTSQRDDAVVFTLKVLNEHTSRHNFEFSLASTMTTFKQEHEKLLQCTFPSINAVRQGGIPQLEMYLETDVNPLTGNGSSPPKLRTDTHFRKTRLLLKKRVNHHIASDTQQWCKGRDPFYISCIHRFRNGYLCVKKTERVRQPHGSDTTQVSGDMHSSQSMNGSTTQITPTEEDATPASQPSVQRDTVGHTKPDNYRVCIKSSVHCHCEEGEAFMLFWLKPIT